ncbi:MAG: hemerythrin domain-containing protein [Acidobacteria bacterium]|nr:hemerythrin domain-containing protein [Acidobacteriota bacterium]
MIIERTLSPETAVDLGRRVENMYELELRNHFEVEERILFPAILSGLGPTPLVDELVAEHRKLEALVEGAKTAQPAALLAFAAALSGHIRREERELFEDIQKRLTAETLAQLGRSIDAEVARVCL